MPQFSPDMAAMLRHLLANRGRTGVPTSLTRPATPKPPITDRKRYSGSISVTTPGPAEPPMTPAERLAHQTGPAVTVNRHPATIPEPPRTAPALTPDQQVLHDLIAHPNRVKLSRPDASTVHTMARLVHAGDPSIDPAHLHDALMDHGDMHYDTDTLHALLQPGPHSVHVHPQTGRVWARVRESRPHPHYQAVSRYPEEMTDAETVHEAQGPGGHFVVTHQHNVGSELRDTPYSHFYDVRKWGEHNYPELMGAADLRGHGEGYVVYHDRAGKVAAADRLASRFPSEEPVRLARKADTNRVPEGASALFADYIHPAFRGTATTFHTLALLKRLRTVARDVERDGTTTESPHAAPRNMARVARAILKGKKTVTDWLGERVNPFKYIGAWFKKVNGDGLGAIPKHLEDFHDRYNAETADRRHQMDRHLYELIHDLHGRGDHERTDAAIAHTAHRLRNSTEEQKRVATTKVREQLAKRIKPSDVPGEWHREVLNSLDRLNEYRLDRQMLQDEALEQSRQRIVRRVDNEDAKPKRVGWKQWFMGSGGLAAKRSDPMRLARKPVERKGIKIAAASAAAEERGGYRTLDSLPDTVQSLLHAHQETGDVGALHMAADALLEAGHHYIGTLATEGLIHPRSRIVTHTNGSPAGAVRIERVGSDFARTVHLTNRKNGRTTSIHVPSTTTDLIHAVEQLGAPADVRKARGHIKAGTLRGWFGDEPPVEPVKLSRNATASASLGHALRELGSRNQQAREEAARRLLREAGEPGSVSSVLAHHPERGFRPSVMAALAVGEGYARDAASYLGAWHGSLTQEPDTVAFHSHEDGADRMHVVHTSADPRTLAETLTAAGVHRFAIRPSPTRSTAFVYDRGGMYDLKPLATRLPNGIANHATGTGKRLGEGAGSNDDGSVPHAAYREHIRAGEGTGGSPPAAA